MHRAWLAALPLCLLACSQAAPVPETPPLRVVIGFTQARQLADARTLAELGQIAGVKVDYRTAISTRAAAYLLHCPGNDPQCEGARERLARQAGIAYVEIDRREDIR